MSNIKEYEFEVTQIQQVMYRGKIKVTASRLSIAESHIKAISKEEIESRTTDWEQDLTITTTVENSLEVYNGDRKIR